MSAVISLENVGKKYIIKHQTQGPYTTLRETISERFRGLGKKEAGNESREEFWALKDVSFQVEQGDRVGIIGRNGAGKSTLLKLLSRITEPSVGRIKLKGRVASLLEVGTGFHPELSGRENIFLNGAILGMSNAEIRKKFSEIVEFAEVEKFLDTPVKRYSSGMYVRLAFAVAAHLEPEILIIDEVLAVGDVQFQKKCIGKIEDVGQQGRTVLFVSHSMATIQHLCTTGILLDAGQILMSGPTKQVIDRYLNYQSSSKYIELAQRKDRVGNQLGRFLDLKLINDGNSINNIDIGDSFAIEVSFNLDRSIKNPEIGILFGDSLNEQIVRAHSWESYPDTPDLDRGVHKIRCLVENFPLLQGNYNIHLWLGAPGECWDYLKNAGTFNVNASDIFSSGRPPKDNTCTCYFKHSWEFLS